MLLIRRVIHARRFCTAVARRAEDIMPNPDCRPTSLSSRVTYLAALGYLDTAAMYARLAVFTKMKSEFTTITCQTIIENMVREKRHEDAHDLYDFFFNQHNLRPNCHSCNYILESLFQQGLVEEALDFHRSLPGLARGYPSEDTFRVLTKGLVDSGRLDQALGFLTDRTDEDDRFLVSRGQYPDDVAFNNVIRGYLDLGDVDKAKLVFDDFKHLCRRYSGYEDAVAFLTVAFMEYWFKQGKEVEAMECHNQSLLLEHKLPVSRATGNALLKVLLRYGKKDHAWALYHRMCDDKIVYNDTVMIMVKECFDMGRCSEAIETYNKAKPQGYYNIIPETNLFTQVGYLITRCCENGMLLEAESLFADSLACGFGFTDVAAFEAMIHGYVKAGRFDDALKTSNKMIDVALEEVSHLF
ncbi:unnamed protein product [Microthlaspi erraticum]|uniref:Pentacotripeptide-repeat region of PRORP domain-containing protein n=1 Tax=Microthlaspi erraticum TaxID=1685480 RepID=A0A6D2I865_9BRAS|nr:unnamed protein product [Microthlaspi erraticum]